jgi:ribosomal protein S18 acetylase RimI-like enzyme
METNALCWDVEEACMNAWPTAKQALFRGWLFRAAGGAVRRTNSINPLRGSDYDPRRILDDAARFYARHDRPLIFRVPEIASGLDAALAELGYAAEAETCTIAAPLEASRKSAADGVELDLTPSSEWLAARAAALGGACADDHAAALASIVLPKAFVSVRNRTAVVSRAFGVIDRRYLVVESVWTKEEERNRGFARRAVAALMEWGRRAGARMACLQAMADNAPARALYARLGFATELYRYCYRRAPAPPA